MKDVNTFFSREIDPGMGMAVAKRTYLRKNECWADVAMRVSEGNASLVPTTREEQLELTKAIAKASFLPAGRHLQHGDHTQKDRNIEVFSNCSTANSSFIKFYLLLNGSGVGRMYNNDLMLIDWRNMPEVIIILSPDHPDFKEFIETIYRSKIDQTLSKLDQFEQGFNLYVKDIERINPYNQNNVHYDVEDSREGWAKGLELLEVMAYEKRSNSQLVLDLSNVRERGKPIGGMQKRPASGPAPLAYAYWKTSLIRKNIFTYYDEYLKQEIFRDLGPIDPWFQTILIDHYQSECVANGGARRSARISVKVWTDLGILDFINLKHNFLNSNGESILWSSNNSVGVDSEFWDSIKDETSQAYIVYQAIIDASYGHGTGEPGLINLDKLTANESGI
jgi:hypothetical protein